MDDSSRFRILRRFHPYANILEDFNFNHFRPSHRQRNLRRVFRAFCTTLLICPILASIVLVIWHIFDDNADEENFLVAIPLVCNLTRTVLAICSMIWQKDIITGAMQRLQRSIERSKWKKNC